MRNERYPAPANITRHDLYPDGHAQRVAAKVFERRNVLKPDLPPRDLERVVVDTTVQPKAIAHPTDARLCYRALEKLVDLAKCNNVVLRQSYMRVAKRAAIMVGRYIYAISSNGHGAHSNSCAPGWGG